VGTRTAIDPGNGGCPQIQFTRVKVTYSKKANFVVAGGVIITLNAPATRSARIAHAPP